MECDISLFYGRWVRRVFLHILPRLLMMKRPHYTMETHRWVGYLVFYPIYTFRPISMGVSSEWRDGIYFKVLSGQNVIRAGGGGMLGSIFISFTSYLHSYVALIISGNDLLVFCSRAFSGKNGVILSSRESMSIDFFVCRCIQRDSRKN